MTEAVTQDAADGGAHGTASPDAGRDGAAHDCTASGGATSGTAASGSTVRHGAASGGGRTRRRVTVRGVVQGVGFRPFAHRLATGLALTGHVSNSAAGVIAEVEGPADAVEEFCRRLRTQAPPLAAVREVTHTPLTPTGDGEPGFTIRTSAPDSAPTEDAGQRTLIPPDTATCADCLRELADPGDRRHRHPFITCTHCGPRFTIATALPYDRATTTMSVFPLCPACAAEYTDPLDRRFHAQPVACHDCGPRLRLTPSAGLGLRPAEGAPALAAARLLLAEGAVLAVKGVGGYHLACDAANSRAVATLRRRKARGDKPFAVMCADAATAARLAHVSPAERAVLTAPRRPIVLLRRLATPGPGLLADGVCPGSPDVGVLLPYTPLHQLLFGLPGDPPGPRTLVLTSGNRSGEPIVTDDADALTRLAGLADAWLGHDRRIDTPCDDSVVRVRADGTELVLRRSRGYAPTPLPLPITVRPTLAVGGDLKNTLCLAEGEQAFFSAHLGDMGDVATLDAFTRAEQRLRALTGIAPQLLAADPHPGYQATRWARRHAAGRELRLVRHHHAHVASALAEHGLDGAAPVIGVAFDGTGYGADGAVWGGEVLLADYAGYRRLAHLAYAPLPGGDAGVANCYRTALARLRTAGVAWDPALPCVAACPADERRLLSRQLERDLACVPTSSTGRLFDAVSSLVGVCHRAGYEAQAAIELEAAAARAWPVPEPPPGYTFAVRAGAGERPDVLDPAPLLATLADDVRRGIPAPVLAARFHRALASAVVTVCRRARQASGATSVALTGGVFANALLDEACAEGLRAHGFTVLRHGQVPPGDGGLALGQLLVAAHARPAHAASAGDPHGRTE
ncbi:carbamoyltransferase HypF [Streptomyces sp. JJ66]|uniref:carbamoyltransferase HypF n=1 Tax=Streptomyces sp. JJ66 TaxID=2803843 RepID=UPI001C57C229|nr:carbamoyltransferase HypF [Streptomyces sp. JJ66]MBW1601929.1 carbamoyltransferase HypF [Streptomyces sp. JJ66]